MAANFKICWSPWWTLSALRPNLTRDDFVKFLWRNMLQCPLTQFLKFVTTLHLHYSRLQHFLFRSKITISSNQNTIRKEKRRVSQTVIILYNTYGQRSHTVHDWWPIESYRKENLIPPDHHHRDPNTERWVLSISVKLFYTYEFIQLCIGFIGSDYL